MNSEKGGMASHIKSVHQVGLQLNEKLSNVFPCAKCPSKFKKEVDLVKHIHLYHGEKNILICEHCKRPYDAGPLRTKACSCIRRGAHQNNVKSIYFDSKQGLNQERERSSVEKENKGAFVCECGRSFAFKRYLATHKRL